MTPTPVTPSPSSLQNLTKKAIEDLAQQLSIPETQIQLVEARDVIWTDSSLGCPQPGMAYADVLTSGYLILLNVNGQSYEYHAGKNSNVFHCSDPLPPVENMSDNT